MKAQYGNYVARTKEFESEEEKKAYIMAAIPTLIASIPVELHPNWNTFQVIIREGTQFADPLDLDAKDPMYWIMTVGIKFEGENDGPDDEQ